MMLSYLTRVDRVVEYYKMYPGFHPVGGGVGGEASPPKHPSFPPPPPQKKERTKGERERERERERREKRRKEREGGEVTERCRLRE